jgi:uncharacterized protein involved in exopolysaccharide biosynthesis
VQIGERADASDHLTFTRWVAGILLRWRLVAAISVACVLLGLLASVIIPPVYRSKASFVANSSTSSKLQGALGNSTGIGGIISQLGGTVGGDPSESPNFYVQLFSSRELLTRLLESKFPNPRTAAPNDSATLLTILRIRKSDPERRLEIALKQMSKSISTGLDPKTNLVWFSVNARWAELSAQTANKLIELVGSFDRQIRVSRAKSMRVFIQMRHDSAQIALRQAEENQRYFYEKNRGFIGGSPSLRFEEQRIKREVDLASDLYVNLDRQLELARIDEINNAPLITVIDSAVVPRKALWPRYWVTLLSASALGLLIGLLVAGGAAVAADWRSRNPNAWSYFKESADAASAEVRAILGLRRKPRAATATQLVADHELQPGRPRMPASNRDDEPVVNTQRPA